MWRVVSHGLVEFESGCGTHFGTGSQCRGLSRNSNPHVMIENVSGKSSWFLSSVWRIASCHGCSLLDKMGSVEFSGAPAAAQSAPLRGALLSFSKLQLRRSCGEPRIHSMLLASSRGAQFSGAIFFRISDSICALPRSVKGTGGRPQP